MWLAALLAVADKTLLVSRHVGVGSWVMGLILQLLISNEDVFIAEPTLVLLMYNEFPRIKLIVVCPSISMEGQRK